jgi:hypothetical protein
MVGNVVASRSDRVIASTRIGEKVQGWRLKIKEGRDATSPMTSDRYVVLKADQASGYAVTKFITNPLSLTPTFYGWSIDGYLSDLVLGDFAHLGGVSADADAQALSRLYGRIREESYGVNGMLFLGELRETIQFIKRPLSSLQDLTKGYLSELKSTRKSVQSKVRRKKGDTGQSLLKRRLTAVKDAMAGTTLEYQFGIKPFISDVKDIAAEAVSQIYGRDLRTRLRAKSTDTVYSSTSGARLVPQTCIYLITTGKTVTRAGIRYTCGLNRTLSAPTAGLQRVASGFGFQIQNFVPTIYELIPYSFLVDYFSNLGDIIEATCTDTTGVTWVVKTVRVDTNKAYQAKLDFYSEASYPGFKFVRSGGTLHDEREVRHISVTRTRASLSIPNLVLKVPGTDSQQTKNIVALLAQSSGFRFR